MNNKEKILHFMKKEELMVISTLNKEGKPQSAVVAYTETRDLEIIFGTFNNTRKYANLKNNASVSLVIGWNIDEKITIQLEGDAQELFGQELEKCRKLHIAKNPKREKWCYEVQERFFKIKPVWIRYSDLSKEPEEIFEITK